MKKRYLGIDVGAETVKVVELTDQDGDLRWTRRGMVEHHKEPNSALLQLLEDFDWGTLSGAAVSGRASRQVELPRVPTKQAQARAYRFLVGDGPGTVVSIGSHGFSVLELRDSGVEVFRENSRCSQGTGNFLRQLVERFDLDIEQASALCAPVQDPAPLSGRCPVILKTDMTHLANKGESQPRILAGLYDAVCENVQVLIKPRITPPRVLLGGGVSRAERIRAQFGRFCERHEMTLLPSQGDDGLYLEALGSALIAHHEPTSLPALVDLLKPPHEAHLDFVEAPSRFLSRIKRMPKVDLPDPKIGPVRRVVLGFDIGSTGSKAVAIDVSNQETVWEGYINTNGNPVGAAQTLVKQWVEGDAARHQVVAFGATGSGREIVGSLLSTCYGSDPVYVLNEIAAHAEGALQFDPRVDTIFEIGGQDAKYIRLADGRVVDAAMNEACSAGTGSFIEEQGRKFAGVESVVQLGEEALGAESCVSLGQHCSVFMAEIIDEAVAAGVHNKSIIAGIYDSIIQNYLNRVKGSRSVGDVIFCQGMPFSADALAAAVARQTGSEVVIPPNPGTVGALGIALLTLKSIEAEAQDVVDPRRFLEATVLRKDTFVCSSTKGCGGAGNFCRIDRIDTLVAGKKQRFTWGGGCSLWDRGTRKQKLPDLAPDPFREREDLVEQLLQRLGAAAPDEAKTVALADEFQIKTLLPFFATFIAELGFKLDVHRGADHGALKRGIEEANVPFCAPMQQFHGLVSMMAEKRPDFLFLPMIKDLPRVKDEKHATVCPIVQGSPDMLRWDLGPEYADRVISPMITFGEGGGLESKDFVESCQRVAGSLGVFTVRWWRAYQKAVEAQKSFDLDIQLLGQRALDFCEKKGLTPVVVLGRAYTIYNKVLNSNVPAILREQGSIAIPVDCYPVSDEVPVYEHMYWGFGQRNLRAVHQLRRTPGVYGLWCSNYSCGPDSFSLHFFAYQMEGKPFAVIETDGHSGDAGTKTRIEAFLHCVREDLDNTGERRRPNSLVAIEHDTRTLPQIRRNKERLLIPRMGPGAEVLEAAFNGMGIPAEALPMPDRDTLQIGRRHTSGKECVPMALTLGSLVARLQQEQDPETKFCFFMPTANGPCRFGVYNVLHKITLERLGYKDRVRVWSPVDSGYFEGTPAGAALLIFIGFCAADILQHALYGVRPVERRKGAAQEIHDRYSAEMLRRVNEAAKGELTVPYALLQVANGRLFGVADVLRRAAAEFAAVKTRKEVPAVAVVGEIYVRCDPFANDFVIEKLEERGIRAAFAPFTEWLEYTDHINQELSRSGGGLGEQFSTLVQRRVQARTYNIMAERLGWPPRTTVQHSLAAAAPYVRKELTGEAVLTVGGPLHEWREGEIDGVLSVGPLECMPNKISEAQFFHVAEQEGLASLTLPLNGDPIDPEVLDNYAFEIQARFKGRQLREQRIEEREVFPLSELQFSPQRRNRPSA